MRILFTNWAYNMLCGSQTFIYTLLPMLKRYGHQPLIYSDHLDGLIAEKSRGLAEMSTDLERLRPWDAVWGSHQILRRVPRDAPRCQIVHAVVSRDQEAPIPGLEAHFAVSLETQNLIESCGMYCHGIIRQPIDADRFRPLRPVRRDWPPRVLHLGNYPLYNDAARRLCERLSLPFASIGGPTEDMRRWDVEEAINDADIVIGQSRCALEAMACGRNVIICSGWELGWGYGLSGFLTLGKYERWVAEDNLTGHFQSRIPTEEALFADIRQYNPLLGAHLRRLIMNHIPEEVIAPLVKWTEAVTGKKFYASEKDSGQALKTSATGLQ